MLHRELWLVKSRRQALELLSEVTTVPESEVPLVEVGMVDVANEIDHSNLTMKDMSVVSSDTENVLVPATAAYTDDNNTTHVGMLRFGDCDISVDNAKTSAPHETAKLTFENPNLTQDCISNRWETTLEQDTQTSFLLM